MLKYIVSCCFTFKVSGRPILKIKFADNIRSGGLRYISLVLTYVMLFSLDSRLITDSKYTMLHHSLSEFTHCWIQAFLCLLTIKTNNYSEYSLCLLIFLREGYDSYAEGHPAGS